MVSSFIKSATMAVAMLASTAEAHNMMTDPMPTWPSTVLSKNSPSGHIDPKVLPSPDGKAYTTEVGVYLNMFWTAFNASSYKSLREFVLEVEILEKGATKECGFSVANGTPRHLPDMIEWDFLTSGHKGPFVAYCDDILVSQSLNAADEYPETPAKIPYDKDKCTGASMLTCYWLSLHAIPWQAYTNCARVIGAKPSTKSKLSNPASSPSDEPSSTPTVAAPPPTDTPPKTPTKTPTEKTPTEKTPTKTPTEKTPTEKTPTEKTPTEKMPTEKTPTKTPTDTPTDTPPETPALTVKSESSNPASSPSNTPATTPTAAPPAPIEMPTKTPAVAAPTTTKEPQTDVPTKDGEKKQGEQEQGEQEQGEQEKGEQEKGEQDKEKKERITTVESNADTKDDESVALVKTSRTDKCGVRRRQIMLTSTAQ